MMWSLPIRGAWIEIEKAAMAAQVLEGRSPSGERGLKYPPVESDDRVPWSLPIRGAWIEIGTR